MKTLLLIVTCSLSIFVFGQAGKLKKADNYFNHLSYAYAANLYEELIGSEVDSPTLKSKLAYQRRKSIVLELRERNLDGQLFFRKAGFLCTSILHGWYADYEDSTAYQMEYREGGDFANG